MERKSRNYLEILMAVLLVCGLIYAFYNVLYERIQGQENRENLKKTGETILQSVRQSDRLECNTSVYLQFEEKEQETADDTVRIGYDFLNERLQIERKNRIEIIEYKEEVPFVYSKGISPVYSKRDVGMKNIPTDQWFRYPSEKMYGDQWKKGRCDQIAYGYLTDEAYLRKIERQGEVTEGEKNYVKYKAELRNTLRYEGDGDSGDNEFRKTLSAYGLDVMKLRKGYPEVYKLLREVYESDKEEMYIWVDENRNMVRIDKDHTFLYYMEIMKENSEKIEETVGKYGYPKVYCRQDYTYNAMCKPVEIPEAFKEL